MTPTTTEADTVYQAGPYSIRLAADRYETCKDIDGKTVVTISYHPASPEQLATAIKDANTRSLFSRPLNADKIRSVIGMGYQVYWIHENNPITKDPTTGEYIITCEHGSRLHLTSRRGPWDMNVFEHDVFIKPKPA